MTLPGIPGQAEAALSVVTWPSTYSAHKPGSYPHQGGPLCSRRGRRHDHWKPEQPGELPEVRQSGPRTKRFSPMSPQPSPRATGWKGTVSPARAAGRKRQKSGH